MAKSFAPGSDADFNNWLANFETALTAHYSQVGLTDADADILAGLKVAWDAKYSANNAIQIQAREGTAAKNAARKDVEDALVTMVARIQTYPGTTDELRQAFGLKPRGATPSEVELPIEVVPKVHVDINNKLKHEIVIQTDVLSGDRRWKPVGTMGCEIYRKVGEKPTGPQDMEMLMMTAKSKVVLNYEDADGGKTVHYMTRYVTRDGETGPWSDLKSVPVAA